MRWTRIQEGWDRIDEQVRARWKLLDAADVQAIQGDRDSLLDKICARYALPRDAADWQVSAWQNAYSDRWLYAGAPELG
jgi:hypothetical protein